MLGVWIQVGVGLLAGEWIHIFQQRQSGIWIGISIIQPFAEVQLALNIVGIGNQIAVLYPAPSGGTSPVPKIAAVVLACANVAFLNWLRILGLEALNPVPGKFAAHALEFRGVLGAASDCKEKQQ